MGMSIDTAKTVLFDILGDKVICEPTEQNKAIVVAIKTMQSYQMMQADYNARLKADMVAMLTEIQLEIEDNYGYDNIECSACINSISRLLQEKINALKGE